MGLKRKRFGYADNISFLEVGHSLHQNCEALSLSLNEAPKWGESEGNVFDSAKSELQHFSRNRADRNLATTPSVSCEGMTISENVARPYTRWLGVHFDRTLSFKWHVLILASKAIKVANALRSLSNTSRGISPQLIRQAVIACVLPIAYYGVETWWPRRSRYTTRLVSNRVEGHISLLRKVVLAGARATLPVFRTTPSAILFHEAGLLPLDLELDWKSKSLILRYHRLDPQHPLRQRARHIWALNRRISHYSGWVLKGPKTETIDALIQPPWFNRESWHNSIKRVTCPLINSLIDIPFSDLVAYPDVARSEGTNSPRAGCRVIIFQAGQVI